MRNLKVPHANFNDGRNQAQIQKYNAQMVYSIGFTFTGNAGVANPFPTPLGGKARFLHGIVVTTPAGNINDADVIALSINQEQIIQKVPIQAYLPNVNIFKENQFYKLGRTLTGSDTSEFTITPVNTHTFGVTFYLSNAVPEHF